jgi:hypothetical protein
MDSCERRNDKLQLSVNRYQLREKIFLTEHALPQSPVRQAINYSLNGWAALCRYTEDGQPITPSNPTTLKPQTHSVLARTLTNYRYPIWLCFFNFMLPMQLFHSSSQPLSQVGFRFGIGSFVNLANEMFSMCS